MFGNSRARLIGVIISVFFLAALIFLLTQDFLKKRRVERIAVLSEQCSDLAAKQDWKSLEEAASEWLELDSSTAEVWLNLAEALEKQGRLAESVECLLSVPRSSPKAKPALLYASEMQLGEARQPSKGIETLRELREIAPAVELVRKQLISLYAMTLQRQKMIDEIYDAFQYHVEPPESYVYLMIADHLSFTNGFQMNTQWFAAEPESELFAVARSVQLVDTLRKLEKTTPETEQQRISAEADLGKLFAKYPANEALRNFLIEDAILKEDVSLVGTMLADLPENTVEDSLLWRFRGWHAMMTQQYPEAEEFYKKSIAQMPLDWHAWHELAAVLRRQAKLDEAESAAQIALTGKELRKECLTLPDASRAPPDLLHRIYLYAVTAGDQRAAKALKYRH